MQTMRGDQMGAPAFTSIQCPVFSENLEREYLARREIDAAAYRLPKSTKIFTSYRSWANRLPWERICGRF
jgi:hypothetical protein